VTKAADQNGTVLFNGTIETLSNGVFELWFPGYRRIDRGVQTGWEALYLKRQCFQIISKSVDDSLSPRGFKMPEGLCGTSAEIELFNKTTHF